MAAETERLLFMRLKNYLHMQLLQRLQLTPDGRFTELV